MIFAALVRLITGVQARWIGCAPELKQRIYFANHVSNLDGPVIWASLPTPLRRATRPIAAVRVPIRRQPDRLIPRALTSSGSSGRR